MGWPSGRLPEQQAAHWTRNRKQQQTDHKLRNRLNAAEQRELQGRMERKQMKDFMNVRLSEQRQPYPHSFQ
jgi:hypothetical protein